jgi:hypothetical protein
MVGENATMISPYLAAISQFFVGKLVSNFIRLRRRAEGRRYKLCIAVKPSGSRQLGLKPHRLHGLYVGKRFEYTYYEPSAFCLLQFFAKDI